VVKPNTVRSVVLASYQGERFIGEQLDSILPQLGPQDEIVVSDDVSTDRTLEVIARRGDARIRVLRNDRHLGYVANFQRAIAGCRGDSVFFCDQDDIWLPNKVAMLDNALRAADCAASDAIVVDERLETLHRSFFELLGARHFSCLSLYWKPSVIGATVACRRDYLETLLPFPAGVPHDYWLTFNAACDNTLAVLPVPLILYRRHTDAFSVTATDRRRPVATVATERMKLIGAMLRHRYSRRSHAVT